MADVTLFSATFDSDEEGFVYRDDAFRDTGEPDYADGDRVATAGFGGSGALPLQSGIWQWAPYVPHRP